MSAIKGVDFIQKKITPLLNFVLTNKHRLLQSTLALRASLYYRHRANTDSCWIPGENFRRLTETNSRLITNSRDYGLQSTSCGNILVELSQIIIYFFLFLCSSLSPWLKSKHSDFCLTSYLYETTVLTCKKTVRMHLMYLNWNFNTVLYGFSVVLYLMNADVVTISTISKYSMLQF